MSQSSSEIHVHIIAAVYTQFHISQVVNNEFNFQLLLYS